MATPKPIKRTTDTERAAMLKDRQAGMTLEKIAEKYKRSMGTVATVVQGGQTRSAPSNLAKRVKELEAENHRLREMLLEMILKKQT